MSDKKKLLKLVFAKAQKDSSRTTKNALANYLSYLLEEKFNCCITDRTLIRYYDAFIDEEKGIAEIAIENFKLDTFSQYLGFKDYENFANSEKVGSDLIKEEKFVHSFTASENSSEIKENIINITIQNFIKIPEFITKNKGMSMGIMGVIIAGAGFAQFGKSKNDNIPQTLTSQINNTPEKERVADYPIKMDNENSDDEKKINTEIYSHDSEKLVSPQLFISEAENHMYWNGNRYILTTIQDKDPSHEVIPANEVLVNYFEKITKPDTLTVRNAIGKVWYSKHQNKVEFFTMDGKNPENGKELHPATEHMIEKYAGKNAGKD